MRVNSITHDLAESLSQQLGDDFYKSTRWRSLRRDVLKKYGSKCMCCGATEKIHVDHIKPRSLHHRLAFDFNNMQVLCELCNTSKSNLRETDYRNKIVEPKRKRLPPSAMMRKNKKADQERKRSIKLTGKLAAIAHLPSSQFVTKAQSERRTKKKKKHI